MLFVVPLFWPVPQFANNVHYVFRFFTDFTICDQYLKIKKIQKNTLSVVLFIESIDLS